MAGTRQSTRIASQGGNSSPPSATPANGTKRKADAASPTSNKKKQQKTLEEVVPDDAQREEVKAAIANEGDEDKVEKTAAEDETEKQESNGDAGKTNNDIEMIADLLTHRLAASTKTEENGANGHDDAEKSNAFDKIQADENDEGTTGAKVRGTTLIHIFNSR